MEKMQENSGVDKWEVSRYKVGRDWVLVSEADAGIVRQVRMVHRYARRGRTITATDALSRVPQDQGFGGLREVIQQRRKTHIVQPERPNKQNGDAAKYLPVWEIAHDRSVEPSGGMWREEQKAGGNTEEAGSRKRRERRSG